MLLTCIQLEKPHLSGFSSSLGIDNLWRGLKPFDDINIISKRVIIIAHMRR